MSSLVDRMPTLSFHLPVFDGPMDLLLHLIAKHKLNIHDIEIAVLLEQYLLYIEQCAQQDYELAGEFLEMAARLIWMKTVSLLPAPEEAAVAKKELEGALIEYSLCKRTAELLRAQYLGDVLFVRKPVEIPMDMTYRRTHPPTLLLDTYRSMDLRKLPQGEEGGKRLDAKIHEMVQAHHHVTSVFSKVVYILRQFFVTDTVIISGLFDDLPERTDRVAVFLAILELTKAGRILISEDGTALSMRNRAQLMGHKRQAPERKNV